MSYPIGLSFPVGLGLFLLMRSPYHLPFLSLSLPSLLNNVLSNTFYFHFYDTIFLDSDFKFPLSEISFNYYICVSFYDFIDNSL